MENTITAESRSPQTKGVKRRFRLTSGLYTGPDESITRYRVPARVPRSAQLAGKPFDEHNLAPNDVLPEGLVAQCSTDELAALAAFHPDRDYRPGTIIETERDLHGEFDAIGMSAKFLPVGHEVTTDSEIWDKRNETLERFAARMRAKHNITHPASLDVSDVPAGHEQRPATPPTPTAEHPAPPQSAGQGQTRGPRQNR